MLNGFFNNFNIFKIIFNHRLKLKKIFWKLNLTVFLNFKF